MNIYNLIYQPVTYDFDEIIKRAESGNFRPVSQNLYSTASDFSSWVFWLCHTQQKKDSEVSITFREAKRTELAISDLLYQLNGLNGFKTEKDWKIVYQDQLTSSVNDVFFLSDELAINGLPLRCKPDLVVYNPTRSELIIIERKVAVTAEAYIPDYCYPNVLAQLWCYSKINSKESRWPDHNKILLAAEIWTHKKYESEIDGRANYWVFDTAEKNFKYIEYLFEIFRQHKENFR